MKLPKNRLSKEEHQRAGMMAVALMSKPPKRKKQENIEPRKIHTNSKCVV